MSKHNNQPARGQTTIPAKHISQMSTNTNEADLGDTTPTVQDKLDAALSEITRLTAENKKLTDNVGDFLPDGHVMLPLELFQRLEEVAREHNALMPAYIVYEARERGLMDKDSLKNFTAEQTKLIDECMTSPDDVFNSHYDAWIKRNPEYGFDFSFTKPLQAKAS